MNSLPENQNNIKSDLPTYGVETVTPQMAQQWLKRNTNNRPITRAVVKQYAQDMKDGKFRLTFDPVRFDDKGNIIDGQHRLNAVVESDTSVDFFVVRGLDKDVFYVLDTGKKRTAADILSIYGIDPTVARIVAPSVPFIRAYEEERTPTQQAGQSTNEYVLKRIISDPIITKSGEFIKSLSRQGGPITKSLACFLHYEMVKVDPKLADVFMAQLIDGYGLDADSMMLKLREKLIRDRLVGRKTSPQAISAMCVKVWNAMRGGREIKHATNIVWRSDEPFPRIK